jgi:hypothetical protein
LKTVSNRTFEPDVVQALSLACFVKEEWTHFLLLKGHYFRCQSAISNQKKRKESLLELPKRKNNVESVVALARKMAHFHHKDNAAQSKL